MLGHPWKIIQLLWETYAFQKVIVATHQLVRSQVTNPHPPQPIRGLVCCFLETQKQVCSCLMMMKQFFSISLADRCRRSGLVPHNVPQHVSQKPQAQERSWMYQWIHKQAGLVDHNKVDEVNQVDQAIQSDQGDRFDAGSK